MKEEVDTKEMPREFYKADKMLRYNPLWAFILGERSVGKSFEFKRRSITTPDSLWIYLRRTDVLRKDPKNWKSYLSDLLVNGVIDPDREYKVSSEGIWVDGIQKVIFSALSTDSTAHSMNYMPDSVGQSIIGDNVSRKKVKPRKVDEDCNTQYTIDDIVPDEHIITPSEKNHIIYESTKIDRAIDKIEDEYDKPTQIKKKIVFEEILEPKGKYLKNEVEQLFEFYVTVDRYTDTQLFGIANLMSSSNPYFEYFNIKPFTEEFRWFKNKTLLVQNVRLEGMEDFVKSQRFYNLVEGTDYGDYLCNNTPWQDDNYAIAPRPKDSKMVYNIRMYGKLYGIWRDDDYNFYVSTKNNPQRPVFAGLKSKQENDWVIKKGEYAYRLIDEGIKNGKIKFESITVREVCFDIINGSYKEA